MCCGKKNQANKTIANAAAVNAKYFLTQLFLLRTKNEVTKIAPTLLVTTSVASQQYSDLVSFYAQLSTCDSYPTSGSITFKLGIFSKCMPG